MKTDIKKCILLALMLYATQLIGVILVYAVTAIYHFATGGDMEGFQALMTNKDLAIYSMLVGYVVLVVYLLIDGHLRERAIFKGVNAATLGLSALLGLSGIVLVDVITSCLSFLPNIMEAFFNSASHSWIGIIAISIIGPFFEELLFRGAITRYLLKSYSPSKAIVVSALIFGIIHINPAQVVTAFLIGLLLAWIFYRTGSIWPGVIIHIINNSISTIGTITYPDANGFKDIFSHSWIYTTIVALSMIIFCVSFVIFRLKNKVVKPSADNNKILEENIEKSEAEG